jgi:nucleotide-binding universal stress UspA family protein
MTDIAWKRICCAVDYSPQSRAAMRVATDLARRLDAEVTLLHVEDPAHPEDQMPQWKRDVEAAGVRVKTALTSGDPKLAIAEWADGHGADLVVMGTFGKTGRAHALVGSVAENTVRNAKCPVLVIHPEWPGVGVAAGDGAAASP